MKEVIFFANGDPRSASTWSNVPCCFIRTLEKKGIRVHAVSMMPYEWLTSFYDRYIRICLDAVIYPFTKKRTQYFSCTRLHQWLANRIIRKSVCLYRHADYCFFINYLFYNQFSDIPTLMLSDWTQEMSYELKGQQQRFRCSRVFKQEEEAICHAQHVISIFENCAKTMQVRYPTASISFLGGNVVNDLSGLYEEDGDCFNEECILNNKKNSKKILFIGKPDRYRESAKKLVEAVGLLRKEKQYADLELDIVGIRKDQLSEVPEYVHCHGFLHKDEKEECKTFYDLLRKAKVIVNPTPKWAAYSSIIEAMYFYTPVVVSPFDDFVQEFGKNITFGQYNQVFSTEEIAKNIKTVIGHPDYTNLCLSAHETVKDYTWDAYVDKILKLIDNIL